MGIDSRESRANEWRLGGLRAKPSGSGGLVLQAPYAKHNVPPMHAEVAGISCGADPVKAERGISFASEGWSVREGTDTRCRAIGLGEFPEGETRHREAEPQNAFPERGVLLVGVARFELTAPASRRQCSTRLSYTPITSGSLKALPTRCKECEDMAGTAVCATFTVNPPA